MISQAKNKKYLGINLYEQLLWNKNVTNFITSSYSIIDTVWDFHKFKYSKIN